MWFTPRVRIIYNLFNFALTCTNCLPDCLLVITIYYLLLCATQVYLKRNKAANIAHSLQALFKDFEWLE